MDPDVKQLEFLFEYTKFHIGMYVTIIGVIFTILGLKWFDSGITAFSKHMLAAAIILLAVSAMFGALVASAIPYHEGGFEAFMVSETGPWRNKWIEVKTLTHLEHSSFWLAGLLMVIATLNLLYSLPRK